MGRFVISLLLVLTISACSLPTAPDVPPGAIRITGTVHFYTLEGGFWAVRGDDGTTYDPLNLAPAYQRENLRVSMVAKVRNDMASFHMVGQIVEILSIQPL